MLWPQKKMQTFNRLNLPFKNKSGALAVIILDLGSFSQYIVQVHLYVTMTDSMWSNGKFKNHNKSLLVVMAGLGGRRALELLAQGLVEVLAEDRQLQQQQQGLQQQAFNAGMAAAGVIVQQGSTVRPQTQRALPEEQAFQQQQVPLQQAYLQQQQVPLPAVMGPGPGMLGQYFAAAPGWH